MLKEVQIHHSWKTALSEEFDKPYFTDLVNKIKQEIKEGKIVYPKGKDIFAAFNYTPFSEVKVVILGQDPYHGVGQAHGLAFSVPDGVDLPPSLRNIGKEIQSDLQCPYPFLSSGNLTNWASQGVLLLNASLTVRQAEPMSHAHIGWSIFTDAVISTISQQLEHTVFLLWGKFAQQKSALIDAEKHFILKTTHPSPLSVHGGFFGCKHFSKTNSYLTLHHRSPIQWYMD